MSVKVMSWVWDQDLPTTKKMLLLAIADHCDDDGDNAWPSKARLSKKVGINSSYIRRLLRELEDDGWLVTQTQRGGTLQTASDKRPNLYRINIERGALQDPPLAKRGALQVPPRGAPQYPLTISSTSKQTCTPKRAEKTRKPDELFDAIVLACSIDATLLTASARGSLNRATKELREVGAEAEQIATAARAFIAKYPNASLTPTALAKHYPALSTTKRVTKRSSADTKPCEKCRSTGWLESQDAERTVYRCGDCGGDGNVKVLVDTANSG
jgi:hypothetical protein